MHTYSYNSDIGTFEIRPLEDETYELWLEEELLGAYGNAELAAQDVAEFNTDYPEWDRFKNELEKFPSNLRKWAKVKEESPKESDKPEEKTVANLLDMDKDKPKTKKRDVKIIKHEKKKDIPVILDKPSKGETALVPSGEGFISAACTLDEAIATFELFEEAKKRILKDTDVIWIGPNGRPVGKDQGGSPHIKRSGWCRLARFFRVSWKVISNDGSPMLSTDKDGNSKGYIYRAIVHGTHPSGASVIQSGFATSTDPFFTKGGRKDADEEDVAMKAETVGISRVVSNILGSGEVSAEEISSD